MDLSFPPPIPAGDAPLPAADMAALAALLDEGASVRAPAIDSVVPEPLLAPATGAFNAAMAVRLAGWSDQ